MPALFLFPFALFITSLFITGCQAGELVPTSQQIEIPIGLKTEPATADAVAFFGERAHMNNQLSKPATQEAADEGYETPCPLDPLSSPILSTDSRCQAAESLIEESLLPSEIARVALLPKTGELIDFQLDRTSGLIYVTDSLSQLHLLNANTFAPLSFMPDLPTTGNIFLDRANHRLYIYPGDYGIQHFGPSYESKITIIDTESWSLIGTVPGSYLSVDMEGNRFFVGDPVYVNTPEDAPGIRVYHGDTLFFIGEIPQPGMPVYNTLRDELLIVAYTVYSADPLTLQIITDLLPELGDQELPWCNGCDKAVQAHVFPNENIVALELTTLSAGKGAGLDPEPRFFNAMTMRPIGKSGNAHSFVKFALQQAAGSHVTLRKPVDGRVYRDLSYSRYVLFNNLAVYNESGILQSWHDGLEATFVNPATKQAYADNGHTRTVLDLNSLIPLGKMTPGDIFMVEDTTGQIYAKDQNELLLFSTTGGSSQSPSSAISRPLPNRFVTNILPSPNYANDHTLFALIESREIYRSTDGGQHWLHLQGGLPLSSSDLVLDLAISPNYANDYTLFAGGARGNYWGEGVLRSVDGGETWQALWNNLTHLRVQKVVVSPTYAEDGIVLAYARYNRLDQWESGESLFLSEDRGEAWSLLATKQMNATNLLPPPEALFSTNTHSPTLPVRIVDYGRELESSSGDGHRWRRVDGVGHEDNYVKMILPSPTYEDDQILYILGEYDLWRTVDGGQLWERWADSRLVGRDYTNALKAAAISPILTDGTHQLFIGTTIGEFWTLHPASLRWESVGEDSLTNLAADDVALEVAVDELPVHSAQPFKAVSIPTSLPALPVEPPVALYRPEGELAQLWENDQHLQNSLGWATELYPIQTAASVQFFEGGLMIWRADTSEIYVLFSDSQWLLFKDSWTDGQPESDPNITPPDDHLQPIRGFGKVWRTHPEVRAKLRWAIDIEAGNEAAIHPFKDGLIIRFGEVVHILALLADGEAIWH